MHDIIIHSVRPFCDRKIIKYSYTAGDGTVINGETSVLGELPQLAIAAEFKADEAQRRARILFAASTHENDAT